MKLLSLISLSLLPIFSSFNTMANNAQQVKQEISFLSSPREQDEYQSNELWYQSKSPFEILQLKDNLINSINLVHNNVIINKKKLSKKLWLGKFNFLTSEKYKERLNVLHKFGLLKFDDKSPMFTQKSQSRGFWLESSWWWMGYWKAHFEHDLVQKIAWVMSTGGDLSSVLNEAMGNHPSSIFTQMLTAVLSLTGFIWDKIPRLTIHFYLIAIVFVQPW